MGTRLGDARLGFLFLGTIRRNQLAYVGGHAGARQVGLQADKFVFFFGNRDVDG